MEHLMDCLPDNHRDRIPVLLVTGFLGSGKTTLVNRMLKSHAYAKAAVVVNEFGEVSVDHMLIDAPSRRMRIVDGGCICGHVHEEIATSLLDLLEHRGAHAEAHFDRVLIETSGLADPVPVIQVLLTDPLVAGAFELRSVVTVCDGMHGMSHLGCHEESVKQATVADVLIVSKIDVADAAVVEALASRLTQMNPGAALLRGAHGDVDSAVLDRGDYSIAARGADARAWLNDARYALSTPAAASDPSIRTFTLTHDEPITTPGLVLWMNLLAGFRGAGLLRVKGIVNVEGKPYAIQAVQTIVSEPVALERWPEDHDRRSRLVFITRDIPPEQVQRTFGTFAFEGGRDRRNMVIRPETYARFKSTMEVFREGSHCSSKAPLALRTRNAQSTSA